MPAPQKFQGEKQQKAYFCREISHLPTIYKWNDKWPSESQLSPIVVFTHTQQFQTILAPDIHRHLHRMSLCFFTELAQQFGLCVD